MYMPILNFTYPLRCLRVPPVEYHCTSSLATAINRKLNTDVMQPPCCCFTFYRNKSCILFEDVVADNLSTLKKKCHLCFLHLSSYCVRHVVTDCVKLKHVVGVSSIAVTFYQESLKSVSSFGMERGRAHGMTIS
jgi:hypothetical protein